MLARRAMLESRHKLINWAARAAVCKHGEAEANFPQSDDTPLFFILEHSTARFQLNPVQALILFFDLAGRPVDEYGAALRIEMIKGADRSELAIWTAEQEMFFLNEKAAPRR